MFRIWRRSFTHCKRFNTLAGVRYVGPSPASSPRGRNSQIDVSHLSLLKMSQCDNLRQLFKSWLFFLTPEPSRHLSLSLKKINQPPPYSKNTPKERKCSFPGSIINVVTSSAGRGNLMFPPNLPHPPPPSLSTVLGNPIVPGRTKWAVKA